MDEARRHVRAGSDHPMDAQSTDAFGTHGTGDVDEGPLTEEGFRAGLRVNHVSGNLSDEAVFDVAGIPTPLANAVRRILLAEIPTVCIESVYVDNNTSVIPDEILAHRLGLVPIHADPALFEWRPPASVGADAAQQQQQQQQVEVSDTDTLVFGLHVRCTESAPDPATGERHVEHSSVYSGDLVWMPQGDQEEVLGADPPRPVHKDILLAKLRPGQEIELQCFAHKGIGRDHAKFSPVATAAYRLLPSVVLTRRVEGDEARALAELCPMGVIGVEGDEADGGGSEAHAVIVNSRACTVCRNCIREEYGFADTVKLLRVRDHFVFSVESTGVLPARSLFPLALKVLASKCARVASQI